MLTCTLIPLTFICFLLLFKKKSMKRFKEPLENSVNNSLFLVIPKHNKLKI